MHKTLNNTEPASSKPIILTEATLSRAVDHLAQNDPVLAQLVREGGIPPLWARTPGFPTLIHIILEQQVSLASARAAFTKLTDAVGDLTPGSFLAFSDYELKVFGFSRQKTSYCRSLAQTILQGDLILEDLLRMEDSAVRSKLTSIKGIGPWTANIYLLMALLRPDIWPTGDLALAKAVQQSHNLPALPNQEELDQLSRLWKPWRAVAARILWHYYLRSRGQ